MVIFQKFTPSKRAVIFSLLLFAIASVGIFGYAHGVYAEENVVVQKLMEGFGALVALVIQLVGRLVTMVLYILMAVAQYNDFIYSTAVSKGWGIVRDICNMFFVLVLLAIAAGTILQQEKYHYSKTLPKLILMAILINFSKTICGLLIDFSQVVMMTFVGAFSGAGPGNFMALLGIQNLLKMTEEGSKASSSSVFISLLLAVVYVFVALIVLMVITVQFIIRIVALWFLVTLSPFAFFLSALPQGEKYASKWWEQFTNYVILGPVLAFFLWISLAVTQNAALDKDGNVVKNAGGVQIHRELGKGYWPDASTDKNAEGFSVGDSIAGTVPGTAGFILGIIMLLASLIAAQQLSSVGGGMAMGAMSGMGKIASGAAKSPFQLAGATARGAGKVGVGAAKKVGSGAVNLAKNVFTPKNKNNGGEDESAKNQSSPGTARPPLAKTGAAAGKGVAKAGSALGGGFTKGANAASSGIMRAGAALGPAGAVIAAPLAGAVRVAGALGGGVIKAGSAVAGGAIKAGATLANTNWKALGGAGKNKLQAGMGAAKSKMQSFENVNAGDALKAVGGAMGRGAKATGGFLKEDAKKTLGHAKAGAGAISTFARTDVGALAKKGVEKTGEAVKSTQAYKSAEKIAKESEGLFGFTKTKPDTKSDVVPESSAVSVQTGSEAKEQIPRGEATFSQPRSASAPSSGTASQTQPLGEVEKMQKELSFEQDDQRRIQKGRKQAESALLGLDEKSEGFEMRKAALGGTVKRLDDQEQASAKKSEILKTNIRGVLQQKRRGAEANRTSILADMKMSPEEKNQKLNEAEARIENIDIQLSAGQISQPPAFSDTKGGESQELEKNRAQLERQYQGADSEGDQKTAVELNVSGFIQNAPDGGSRGTVSQEPKVNIAVSSDSSSIGGAGSSTEELIREMENLKQEKIKMTEDRRALLDRNIYENDPGERKNISNKLRTVNDRASDIEEKVRVIEKTLKNKQPTPPVAV